MGGPNKDTTGNDTPTDLNDPRGWEHTGTDTPRDPRGSTYGGLPGKDDPENAKEHATLHEKTQEGADVRPDAEAMPETLPVGLQQERKGPYGKTTSRRGTMP